MKKFTKICLLASLFLIIMGGTLCMIGSSVGGWRLAKEVGESNSWVRLAWSVPASYGLRHMGIWKDMELEETGTEVADTISNSGHAAENGGYRELERTVDYGSVPQDYEDTGIYASDVKELKVEIGGARLYLLESESDSFGIKIEGRGKYRSYEEKGTFYLEGNMDEPELWKNFDGMDEESVYLYLPKGLRLKDAEIEVGGGLVEIEALAADEIELAVGAGKITADFLECASLDVEVGAGEASLYQLSAKKLDMEIDMGTAFLQGEVSHELDIECGMGEVVLELSGNENDFNYEIECALGSIEVGGREYGSLESASRINNGASGECSLSCSMGTITVAFIER